MFESSAIASSLEASKRSFMCGRATAHEVRACAGEEAIAITFEGSEKNSACEAKCLDCGACRVERDRVELMI